MNNIFLTLIFFIIVPNSFASEILVSAASDLTGAFKEIGAVYEKETGNKVILNFGSSGILAQQIEGGAPVDLFAAANKSYIDNIEKKGFIIPETKVVYAVGGIAIATSKPKTRLNSVEDLLRPEIKRIAIANPSHAPYGMAAREAMERAGVWDSVREKIVYGENIRQATQYLETESVDAAVIALSFCNAKTLDCFLVPQELYAPIEQTLAVIKGSGNEKAARQLADFIVGPKGRRIMQRHGFGIPNEKRRP